MCANLGACHTCARALSRCWADDMGGRACCLESRCPSELVTGRGVARRYALVVSPNRESYGLEKRGEVSTQRLEIYARRLGSLVLRLLMPESALPSVNRM